MRVREYSRNEVAELLKVTPARVSQIALFLGVEGRWARGSIYYKLSDVRRMQQRDTKPGPKPNGKGKGK